MMERMFAILLLVTMLHPYTYGHDYYPMAKEGKVWNMTHGDNTTFKYTTMGDTIISQQDYKKLWVCDPSRYSDDNWHYFAAVRDADKKVFIVYEDNKEEILLYDFNEKYGYWDKYRTYGNDNVNAESPKGDTLFVFSDGSPVELVAFNWFVYNGEKRGVQRVVSMNSSTQNEWFVEGVGATASFGDPFAFGLLSKKPKLEWKGGGLLSCWEDDRCVFTHDLCQLIPTLNCSDNYNDTYPPVLREGRTWNYRSADGRKVELQVRGDSLTKSGMLFKKLYARGPESDNDEWSFRVLLSERGKQVFCLSDERLLFDFAMPGNTLESVDGKEFFNIVGCDSIYSANHAYRRIKMRGNKDGHEVAASMIEGIGSDRGILPFVGWSTIEEMGYEFLSCYDRDVCIYDVSTVVESILHVSSSHTTSNGIFDLQGRRLLSKPKKGVYIENGRKRVVQ